ncbi:relaxase/mobilization nuclease domain-containing protein [Megasphaera elsdenii]|uniref:relaxase/mobilization nuclease domain-containing protein n=1 Tax=Megasphaera elsdenii TaxID=907 RepID=UPI0009B901A9|nr:relaxase/mobilization nuclease domain-containing protein [Megasphaera elsdenii]
MAIIKAAQSGASLKHIINYVTQPKKTEEHLIAGVDCDPQNAYDDMMLTKELFHKTNGRQYKHFIYSFPPGEAITPEQVLENAQRLVTETPALQGYQALIAVHQDRKHIHAHIVVNSVHIETGYKLQWSKQDLADLKERCNTLSQAQGLSVPEKGPDITAWTMPKQQALSKALAGQYQSYYLEMADAISTCQSQSVSRTDFVRMMDEKGIQVTWTDKRKHITFADAEGHKVRDSNFEKTLKIPCSKDSLEAHFAENAKNIQALKKLQEESAKTEKASFWKSLTQSIAQTVASWRKQHQEAATQEALQIAAQTSMMTEKEVSSHEIPATVRTSGRISSSTPDRGTPEQGRKTNSRDSGTEEREGTTLSGDRRPESRHANHQRKHYLSSTRNNARKSRDQGMER